ncbi:hypothetical protein [Metamycoplasma arthritidis]|uniref:Uncharacterized protein n=2 Tax=root TaxID=1 RepID=B3PNB0_META1|nr:hypothetical protein [Metamycoplasma arthritidis]ACF07512.1 bacteriophage MAV1 hypothetical protein [Metamycoplasma arthritidis 158L3-1]
MIRLRDYVDYEGKITLYKYKVMNLTPNKSLKIHLELNDLIILEPSSEISGYIKDSARNIIEKSGEDFSTFTTIDSFNFETNEPVFEPLEEQDQSFYLYSLNPKATINFKRDNFYYIDSNSLVEYQWTDDDDENYLFTINFSNVKQLKNYDASTIQYKWDSEISEESTNTVELTFEPSTLISDLVFVGRKKDNDKTINNYVSSARLVNDVYFYPHLMNPIHVQKDYIQWNLPMLEIVAYVNRLLKDAVDVEYTSLRTNILNIFSEKVINKETLADHITLFIDTLFLCMDVTKKVSSGYAEMGTAETNTFKETVYSGNNPKEFCDYKLNWILQETEKFGNQSLIRTFELIILMCSNQIASSYCFKGGLTTEHEFYLPFFIQSSYKNNKNEYKRYKGSFVFKSHYFALNETGQWQPLKFDINKHNARFSKNKTLTFPLLPKVLEEVNISNTPVDFNTENSQNFKYLMWNVSEQNHVEKYLKTEYEWIDNGPTKEYILETEPMEIRDWNNAFDIWLKYERDKITNYETRPILLRAFKDNQNRHEINKEQLLSILSKPKEELKYLYYRAFPTFFVSKHYEVLNVDEGAKNTTAELFAYDPSTTNTPLFTYFKFRSKFKITSKTQFRDDYQYTTLIINPSEFRKVINLPSDPIKVKFELEKDFILENITLKSIFANQIGISLNGKETKTYKLNYSSSISNTETKIII